MRATGPGGTARAQEAFLLWGDAGVPGRRTRLDESPEGGSLFCCLQGGQVGTGAAAETRESRWMRLALKLAGLGMGRTHPNPRVGAVAVRDGREVGWGAHLLYGGPHAEAMLLASLDGGDLRGATVYVNLEPCAHRGKTPPCAPALARAGLRRVVAAIADPHPLVSGRGLALLRGAGVEVSTGLLAAEARELNAPFLWHLKTGRPLVTLKLAISLDGRLAANDGESRWISSAASRERVHRWRSECDALIVGRGTFLADRPRLTARPRSDPRASVRRRLPGARGGWPHQPVRIVVDSEAGAGADDAPGFAQDAQAGPWVVACGAQARRERLSRLEARGVRCWVLPENGGGGVDLRALMERLAREGLLEVMVEGGATLASELIKAGLVDRLRLFQAPCLLGGGRTWTTGLGIGSLAERMTLAGLRAQASGEDLLITASSAELAGLLAAAEGAGAEPAAERAEERCSPD